VTFRMAHLFRDYVGNRVLNAVPRISEWLVPERADPIPAPGRRRDYFRRRDANASDRFASPTATIPSVSSPPIENHAKWYEIPCRSDQRAGLEAGACTGAAPAQEWLSNRPSPAARPKRAHQVSGKKL